MGYRFGLDCGFEEGSIFAVHKKGGVLPGDDFRVLEDQFTSVGEPLQLLKTPIKASMGWRPHGVSARIQIIFRRQNWGDGSASTSQKNQLNCQKPKLEFLSNPKNDHRNTGKGNRTPG